MRVLQIADSSQRRGSEWSRLGLGVNSNTLAGKSAIKVIMCDGNRKPLGTFWRLKATSSDFYI